MKEKQTTELIGRNIKSLRTGMNITQAGLADTWQAQKAGISRIEAGKTNIMVKTLVRIADALKCGLADIVK